MSILKSISDPIILLYVDFRDGTFKEKTNKTVTISNSPKLLNQKGVRLFGGNTDYLKYSAESVGTSDFTVIAGFNRRTSSINRTIIGGGTGTISTGVMPMFTVASTDYVSCKLGATQFNFTLTEIKNNIKTSIALVFDRDSNASSYKDGVFVENVDISSKASEDIQPVNFAIGSLGNSNWGFDGEIEYALIIDGILTPTEVAKLTEELENKRFNELTFSKSLVKKEDELILANELADGDMEASGTSDWTASSATLSKETGIAPDSTQCLRIARNGSAFGSASQICLTVGKTYRITGYCKGDGNQGGRVFNGAAEIWTSSSASGLEYFEEVFRATNTGLVLYLNNATVDGRYVEFDNVLLQEIGKPYLDIKFKSEFGVTANESTHSGFLENTQLRSTAGTYKVVPEEVNGELSKVVECVTAGYIGFPTGLLNQTPEESAQGEWEITFKKADASFLIFFPVHEVIGTSLAGDCYNVVWRPDETIDFRKDTTVLIDGGSTTYPITEWITVRITRDENNLFSVYLNGVSFGTITDSSYTSSKYIVFNMEAGDKFVYASEKGNYSIIKK